MAAVGFKSALERLAKDQPSVGDVHVSSAGGGDPIEAKRRKAKAYAAIAARNLKAADCVTKYAKVEAISDELGLVFGWGIICKENGVEYVDVQDDHIPEDAMLSAAAEFAQGDRIGKEMHAGDAKGQHIFIFPMTAEIAKAMGMTTVKTGLMLGYKPPPEILEKFKAGILQGFSIGGKRIKDEESN